MIILMGVAGSGKSAQGKLLADTKGYRWISTGEILRQHTTEQRREQMLAGKLLKDDEMIAVLSSSLKELDLSHEFILDGFPRTMGQARWLLEQAKTNGLPVTAVLHLEASEEVVKDRLIKRGRHDDTEKAIKKRFEEYEKTTLPILTKFEQEGIRVHHINGERPFDVVHQEILEKLSQGS